MRHPPVDDRRLGDTALDRLEARRIFGIMPDSSDGSSEMRSGTSMTETSESRFGQSR